MSKFKYMIENGTKKDWEMIQEKYPDMWAFMTKVKYDEDDNMLFEIYIDFKIIDSLRLIINDLFNEIYTKLDKNKIENIVLSKPKTIYSFDKINNEIDFIEKKEGILYNSYRQKKRPPKPLFNHEFYACYRFFWTFCSNFF